MNNSNLINIDENNVYYPESKKTTFSIDNNILASKNYVNYKGTSNSIEKNILKSRLIRYNDPNDHNIEETYDVFLLII